jgi:hypothetical protein
VRFGDRNWLKQNEEAELKHGDSCGDGGEDPAGDLGMSSERYL